MRGEVTSIQKIIIIKMPGTVTIIYGKKTSNEEIRSILSGLKLMHGTLSRCFSLCKAHRLLLSFAGK